MKRCVIALFLHFHVYIYMKTSQIFCGVFFLRKSYQTMPLCQNCPICQSPKRAKYYRQSSQILTKRLSVATVIIGALVHQAESSHLWSMPEQLHHLPGALLPRWQQAVYIVSNGLCQNQLYRKGADVNYLWLYSEIPVQERAVVC